MDDFDGEPLPEGTEPVVLTVGHPDQPGTPLFPTQPARRQMETR